jgi:hypothetical protein
MSGARGHDGNPATEPPRTRPGRTVPHQNRRGAPRGRGRSGHTAEGKALERGRGELKRRAGGHRTARVGHPRDLDGTSKPVKCATLNLGCSISRVTSIGRALASSASST